MNNASDPNQANTPLTALLLQLLPADHSAVGNGALFNQFSAACQAAGLGPVTQEDFQAAREALLATGQAVKGRGRGGATARATGADRPAFALQAPAVPATSTPAPAAKRPAIRAKAASATPAPASASGDAQVLAYRHANRRKNNPEVGLVNTASDPEQAKTTYAYDPHPDPVREPAPARGGRLLKARSGLGQPVRIYRRLCPLVALRPYFPIDQLNYPSTQGHQ